MESEIICTLQRITTGDVGTFGTFEARELHFSCVTLELPDRQNRPMISRIPAGEYRVEWNHSKRFKRDLYRVQDVPGRVGILIHPANFAGDESCDWDCELSGCIALGRVRSVLSNCEKKLQPCILDSRAVVGAFEALAQRRPLRLIILDEEAEGAPPILCDEA